MLKAVEFDVSILAFLFNVQKPLHSFGLQILYCFSNPFQPNAYALSTTGNVRVMRQWKNFHEGATISKEGLLGETQGPEHDLGMGLRRVHLNC